MTPLTISFRAKKENGKQPALHFDPHLSIPSGIALSETVKLKGPAIQFASVLAHEVRNPLTNITLSIKMLEGYIKDDHLKVYLDIIMRSSVRINDLMNELIKYQKADEAPAHKYSIHQLLNEVLEITKDRILLKNVTVKKDFAPQDFKMVLNRSKMKIALTNIIINAIEAMSFEHGELRLTTKLIDDKYIIYIEDNGCGISKENLSNIFKPYFTDKPGGLGIGLAATCDILRSNRIEVNVESIEGEWTRFILSIDKVNEYNLFR